MVDVRFRADNDTHRYLAREAQRAGVPVARVAAAFVAEAARRRWRVRNAPGVDTPRDEGEE